jgi:hypothetical protein
MKKDIYLKVILTIIAINLTLIVLRDIKVIPEAKASEAVVPNPEQESVLKVNIVDCEHPIDVNLEQLHGSTIYNHIPVQLKDVDTYDKVPVEVKSWSTRDDVDVVILNEPVDVYVK